MTTHMTGTREEWLASRIELLAAEKELTRRQIEQGRSKALFGHRMTRPEGVSWTSKVPSGTCQALIGDQQIDS